jgi:hypothetical protein
MSLFVRSADGLGCIRFGSIAAAPYPVKREALHPHILDENKDPEAGLWPQPNPCSDARIQSFAFGTRN